MRKRDSRSLWTPHACDTVATRMQLDVPSRIVRHQKLNADHFVLTLDCPGVARHAHAGQFIMLQVRDGSQPLLRRPMSICRVVPGQPGRIEILYKVVGEGTAYLARQQVGMSLRVLGPLGRGFRLPRRARRARCRPVLVSGGVGIAIFPFLADALARSGLRPRLLFGARSRRDLVGLSYFRARRIPIALATEDGSLGHKGYVTRLLDPILAEDNGGLPLELYVCGPTPMMRAVAEMARGAGVACQLALEAHMPCGIGVCLGCVVRPGVGHEESPYRRVCTEGPVFEASEVIL